MKIRRLENNPIIYPNMKGLKGGKGRNINGPCLIKVPKWILEPLGKYYLYFGHHQGKYIRLAYADSVEGPYTVYKQGTLHIDQTILKKGHIASPEIFIDQERKELWMYYHASIRGAGIYSDQGQMTYLAKSKDGIHFVSNTEQLAPFYLRIFKKGEFFYGIAKNDNKDGILVRSKDGESEFERGPSFIKGFRHCALLIKDDDLWIFYSKAGDAPERLLLTKIKLSENWMEWNPSESIEILRPEYKWEGAYLPIRKSQYGGTKPSNALRDPALFEENGKIYLLYSVMGEYGIAIAEISDLEEI